MYFDEKRKKARVYVPGVGKRWLPGTFETRTEAEAAVPGFLDDFVIDRGETVAQAARRFVKEYPRPKYTTQKRYDWLARRLGQDSTPVRAQGSLVYLPKLRPQDVTRPIARAYSLANPSLREFLSALFTTLWQKEDLLDSNPFWNLGLDKSRGRKDLIVLTDDEVILLADTAAEVFPGHHGQTMRGLVYVLSYVGCRPGEAVAIRRHWLRYREEEVYIGQRFYKGDRDTPKNHKTREVVFPRLIHEYVRAVPANMHPDNLVFLSKTGKALTSHGTLKDDWHKIRAVFEARLPKARAKQLREARPEKFPELTMAELRHVCATYCLDVLGLAPHLVAHQLGHTDGGELVIRTYGHPDERKNLERIKAAYRAVDRRSQIKAVPDEDAEEGRAS